MRLSQIVAIAALMLVAGCASTPDGPSPHVTARATEVAAAMVGKPYHYGGNSPAAGFDCSGLVQYSYGRAGMRLPHGTQHLRRHSRTIALKHAQRGDLLFFNEEGKRGSHVAIFIGGEKFVHAPSSGKRVQIARLDDSHWRKSFAEARRLKLN